MRGREPGSVGRVHEGGGALTLGRVEHRLVQDAGGDIRDPQEPEVQ
jgi:hypothetical protein